MGRRRFEHLVLELSLAARCAVPRYRLWMRLKELGLDPERLSREAVLAFCDGHAEHFLAEHDLSLPARSRRRLRRTLQRYDPSVPTPEERLAHL